MFSQIKLNRKEFLCIIRSREKKVLCVIKNEKTNIKKIKEIAGAAINYTWEHKVPAQNEQNSIIYNKKENNEESVLKNSKQISNANFWECRLGCGW